MTNAEAQQRPKPLSMPSRFLIVAFVSLLLACKPGQQQDVMAADSLERTRTDNTQHEDVLRTDTSVTPADTIGAEHTASTALDVAGTYAGVLPCADCQGIETTLILRANKDYILERKYLGKSDKAYSVSGAWQWVNGNVIRLSSSQSTPTLIQVSENKVMMLDASGNHITGNLADQYMLKKVQ